MPPEPEPFEKIAKQAHEKYLSAFFLIAARVCIHANGNYTTNYLNLHKGFEVACSFKPFPPRLLKRNLQI
jgi:hypothetical protein